MEVRISSLVEEPFPGNIEEMFDPDEREPYSVMVENGQYRVVDGEENVILTCGDSRSAEQYAELMNRAFRRGFKSGLRKGRT